MRLSRLEPDQPVARVERVRRAGHRLPCQPLPPPIPRQRVAREDLAGAVSFVEPELRSHSVHAFQPAVCASVFLRDQVGERVVHLEVAQPPRLAEVEFGAGDRYTIRRQLALVVGVDPRCRSELQLALVDQPFARREIGVLACPVRACRLAEVRRGRRHDQAVVPHLVRDRCVEDERIPLLRMDPRGPFNAALVAFEQDPVPPPQQPVDRVVLLRLGQRGLPRRALPLVRPVGQPVRPRDERVAACTIRHLVQREWVQHGTLTDVVLANRTSYLDDRRSLVTVTDLELLTGGRNRHPQMLPRLLVNALNAEPAGSGMSGARVCVRRTLMVEPLVLALTPHMPVRTPRGGRPTVLYGYQLRLADGPVLTNDDPLLEAFAASVEVVAGTSANSEPLQSDAFDPGRAARLVREGIDDAGDEVIGVWDADEIRRAGTLAFDT